jgi:hypothetical protein
MCAYARGSHGVTASQYVGSGNAGADEGGS